MCILAFVFVGGWYYGCFVEFNIFKVPSTDAKTDLGRNSNSTGTVKEIERPDRESLIDPTSGSSTATRENVQKCHPGCLPRMVIVPSFLLVRSIDLAVVLLSGGRKVPRNLVSEMLFLI